MPHFIDASNDELQWVETFRRNPPWEEADLIGYGPINEDTQIRIGPDIRTNPNEVRYFVRNRTREEQALSVANRRSWRFFRDRFTEFERQKLIEFVFRTPLNAEAITMYGVLTAESHKAVSQRERGWLLGGYDVAKFMESLVENNVLTENRKEEIVIP